MRQQQCCCFLLLLLLLLLLLFVIVCRMAKFRTGSLNPIPAFSFSSFKRELRACAEPWRASARHVEAPLVNTWIDLLTMPSQ